MSENQAAGNPGLDQIRVPEDAGEWAGDLERILTKIPPGWGRWIDCGPGWYPIVVELDRQLEELAPSYQVHQVKEKFGVLRYYYALPEETDPYTLENPPPSPDDDQEWQEWETGFKAWQESEQGRAYEKARQDLSRQAAELVARAEGIAARTCERCSDPGVLRKGPWVKTLCESCDQERQALS